MLAARETISTPCSASGTLVTIALAIALGWALFQVAEGGSQLVATLLIEPPPGFPEDVAALPFSEPLVWDVGGRILLLGPLFRGVVELAVVVAVAVVLRRRAAT
jgi:hypothetical protein